MSEDQTQNVSAVALGKRIKLLRGDKSQEEFAKTLGISRAALANYETGRTVPNPKIRHNIEALAGVSEGYLTHGVVESFTELTSALGFGTGDLEGLTPDEWALVRITRLCPDDVINEAISLLVSSFASDEQAKRMADDTALIDLTNLISVIDGVRYYRRGMTRTVFLNTIEELLRQKGVVADRNEGRKK